MKKIINIILMIAVVSSQSMGASWGSMTDPDILTNALNEIGTVETFVEEDGTTIMYSKSFSVRFDNNTVNDQPLFSFTPPSLEVGCNGIDFKGMFMSLLGLDQLGDMLQNAGTTLAWGVAVGLIYSLPGVASAFKFINQWARRIQALLADACNAGIQIGMWLGEKSGVNEFAEDSEVLKWLNELGPKEVAAGKQKGKSILLDALGLSSIISTSGEMDGDKKQKLIVAMFKGIFQSDASVLGSMMSSIGIKSQTRDGGETQAFQDAAGIGEKAAGGVDSSVSKAINIVTFTMTADGSGGGDAQKTFSLSEMAKIATAGTTPSLSAVSQAKLGVFAYILSFNFIGDLSVSVPDERQVAVLFDIVKANVADANQTSDEKKEQAKEQLDKIKKTKNNQITLVGPGINTTEKENGKRLAEFIWYGIKDMTGDTTYKQSSTGKSLAAKNRKLRSPKGSFISLRDEDSGTGTSYIPLLDTNSNKATASLPLFFSGTNDFHGSLLESKCIVDMLVDSNGSASTPGDPNISYAGCGNNGIVFPEIHKYIKIIKDSPNTRRYDLKQKLIQVMAAKLAKALLGAMDEYMSMITTAPGTSIPTTGGTGLTGTQNSGKSSTANDNVLAVATLKRRASEITQIAHNELTDELSDGNGKEGKMESAFEKQNLENQARGLRTLQK